MKHALATGGPVKVSKDFQPRSGGLQHLAVGWKVDRCILNTLARKAALIGHSDDSTALIIERGDRM